MPRQRMVKPEFFASESLGVCSHSARLLFIGLWVMGDDFGNQKAQLTRLKMSIFTYDEMDDERFINLLCELEAVGCIKGYEVDGLRYINIPNFSSYQTVRKPSNTNVPEPPDKVKKCLVTSVIHQWRTSNAPVAHQCHSDALVTHYDCTSDTERKKEGSNFSLREKIANEHRSTVGAAVAGATPPSLPYGWERTGVTCGYHRGTPKYRSPDGEVICPKCSPDKIPPEVLEVVA